MGNKVVKNVEQRVECFLYLLLPQLPISSTYNVCRIDFFIYVKYLPERGFTRTAPNNKTKLDTSHGYARPWVTHSP